MQDIIGNLSFLVWFIVYTNNCRLTNKFSFGRLLLPLIVVYYYLLFIIYTFVEKLEFLTKAPIHLGILFYLFYELLSPFLNIYEGQLKLIYDSRFLLIF